MTIKKDFIRKDGYCRENTIAATLLFFNKNFSKKEILNINNLNKMIQILNKYHLKYIIYLPIKYLFIPTNIYLILRNIKHITLKNNFFIKKAKKLALHKRVIIYKVEASKFYHISEIWNHYLSELIDNDGNRSIYDSFRNQFSTYDYPELNSFNYPKHRDFIYKNILKVIVWER